MKLEIGRYLKPFIWPLKFLIQCKNLRFSRMSYYKIYMYNEYNVINSFYKSKGNFLDSSNIFLGPLNFELTKFYCNYKMPFTILKTWSIWPIYGKTFSICSSALYFRILGSPVPIKANIKLNLEMLWPKTTIFLYIYLLNLDHRLDRVYRIWCNMWHIGFSVQYPFGNYVFDGG